MCHHTRVLKKSHPPFNPFLKKITTMHQNLLTLPIFFCLCTSILNAQQRYSGNSVLHCTTEVENGHPSPSFLYACNGQNPTCQSFFIFKSNPPFNSVPAISKLMSSDPSELACINNVSRSATLPMGKEVIVPVTCSCSGQYYQANKSYVIRTDDETYFTIANQTYQGLSTCSSMMRENGFSPTDLSTGLELRVPLRCACPTSNQIADEVKYLLTYSINWEDDVPSVCKRFNASRKSTLIANGFSQQYPTIHPFTTILIPLTSKPSSTQTIIQVPPPISPPTSRSNQTKETRTSRKGLHVGMVVGITMGSVIVFLCSILSIVICCLRKKRDRTEAPNDYMNGKPRWVVTEDLLMGMSDVNWVLKLYSYEELQSGTENFSPNSRIQGSFYRGSIGRTAVAIKKTNKDISKEVNILNRINHFNLINLYGVCVHEENCYLVYEFMENGSLKDWLRDKSRSMDRSWTQRLQIALDVANGLHYLHNFTKPAHVHKDIKSGNILLNHDLRAKIANFSLARSEEVGQAEGFALTRHAVRTVGHMAPEYSEIGLVTPKLDIYSFGVVMLELITGKDAFIKHDGAQVPLSKVIVSASQEGNMEAKLHELAEPALPCNWIHLALDVARLSVACLRRDPESRPCMGEVVSTLSRILIFAKNWESSSTTEHA